MFFFFFFSSRRRHTRLTCDWSSDVCSSDLDNAGFAPFPAGRNRPLAVRDRSQTLARAPNAAVVAASRARDGLIVVASRNLLAAADTNAATRAFLVALARWTRRPAEWASVGAATHATPLQLDEAPQRVTE